MCQNYNAWHTNVSREEILVAIIAEIKKTYWSLDILLKNASKAATLCFWMHWNDNRMHKHVMEAFPSSLVGKATEHLVVGIAQSKCPGSAGSGVCCSAGAAWSSSPCTHPLVSGWICPVQWGVCCQLPLRAGDYTSCTALPLSRTAASSHENIFLFDSRNDW